MIHFSVDTISLETIKFSVYQIKTGVAFPPLAL